jgi:tetratricopeptide (TPR) repeat protein
MVAGSSRSIFNRVGIAQAILIAGLLFGTSAQAQIQGDVDRCVGKESVSPESRIHSCTALIESKAYAGNELTFAFNSRGLAYYDNRDFDSAVASFNQAIALDPKFAPGYNNRALAYAALGDLDRAIVDYSEAIRLDPANASSLRNRAAAYSSKHDYGRTVADYTAAVKLDPTNGAADGATGSSPPWKSGCEMRPTCHSWRKILPPARCTASVILLQPATCSAEWMPGVRM